jgi:hypothetical protein
MCTTLSEAVAHEPLLHEEGATFDYAIPQAWWEEFRTVMGVSPVWIVWYYPPRNTWGYPYGVGVAAKALLEAYGHLHA